MMFIMFSHAIIKLGVDNINLTFLLPGQSQNENDNAHSVIGMLNPNYLYDNTMGC